MLCGIKMYMKITVITTCVEVKRMKKLTLEKDDKHTWNVMVFQLLQLRKLMQNDDGALQSSIQHSSNLRMY